MEGTDFVSKYKSKVFNIGVIVLALIVGLNLYQAQQRAIEILNAKRENEIKKNGVLTQISSQEKLIAQIAKVVNAKKEVSGLSDKLVVMAKENNVKIISIKPQAEKDFPLYVKYPFDLTLSANYHRISRFISRLESAPEIFMVESLNMKAPAEYQEGSENETLIIDLRLSTIVMKK